MAPEPPWNPDFVLEEDPRRIKSPWEKFFEKPFDLITKPAQWFRENVVLPNRGEKYYWYHRKFGRAVPIDECYTDDLVCVKEADIEFQRNRKVDWELMAILRERYEHCLIWRSNIRPDTYTNECQDEWNTFQKNELNYYIKYGDLSFNANVVDAFMKQKHRMIFERKKAREAQRQ